MSNKLTIAVAVAAGFAGGLLTRYIAPPPVFAQAPNAQAAVSDEIRARSFAIVDGGGNVVGTFTAERSGMGQRNGAHVVLRDSRGNDVPLLGGSMLQPLGSGLR